MAATRKQTAVLALLLLLLLSGCRVGGTGGSPSGPTVSPTATPAEPGGETEDITDTPEPTLSTAPVESDAAVTPAPTGTETIPPEPDPRPNREALEALALEWCGAYRDRFALYDVLHLDRAYWFMDYDAGEDGMTVAFRTADGGPGDIRFQRYETAPARPADAAANMLRDMGVDSAAITFARGRAEGDAALARQVAAQAAEAGLDETGALNLFLEAAAQTVALDENMWYCADAAGTGYLLMSYGDVYRLQRVDALAEYAAAPEFLVWQAYDRAVGAYQWFDLTTMPLDEADMRAVGDRTFYRVDYPGISTLTELRLYLKDLFSDEIVDQLLPAGQDRYVDLDGVLYAQPGDRGTDITVGAEIGRAVVYTSPAKVVARVTTEVIDPETGAVTGTLDHDFPYEKVGEKWVFTDFSLVR